MRIVFPRIETFHFHKAYDGGSKYIYYLSQELVKQGVDVTIVTTQLRENPDLKETTYKRVKYVFLSPKYTGKRLIKLNIPYKFVFSWNLRKYLEKINFDILHSAEAFSYFYLHKKKRKPVIYQCWGMEGWYGREPLSQKGLKKLYVKLFLRKPWDYCLKNSDSIAAEGEYQLPKIIPLGVSKEKIFFLPEGVNFKEIQNLKKKYKDRRKDLGIKKNNLLILSICQIAPDKGIDDIITAFSLVKKEIKNAKLLMIGRGILEKKMYKLIKKYKLEKDVFHLKNIPEEILYDYYFSSDIFVSATTCEDFMITIQEAMACGLAIVSSSQPFLVKDGINGYVVGMKNPKAIKEGILKIYKKKRMKKMGEESKELVKQYDYKNIAKTAVKEYKKLVKEEPIIE